MQVVYLPTDRIRPAHAQIRRVVRLEGLAGLKQSIAEVGLLQPILVRGDGAGGYELVAGARRLAAALHLGETEVPAVVLSEEASVRQVQLVENLQREDLNPVEKAVAIRAFMEEAGLSKARAAEKLGVARTTLTDWLDILTVDERFQRAVVDNFYGGDSPLTLSHVSEALALGARLGSRAIAELLLDTVLEHGLSKVETREVARLIRDSGRVSIREAVRIVRRYVEECEERAGPAELPPAERNLQELLCAVERSSAALERMGHLTGRHLDPDQRARLTEGCQRLYGQVKAALERLEASEGPRGVTRGGRQRRAS